MRQRFLIYFLIYIAFLPLDLSAQRQSGGISGYVIDKKSREPLIGANVTIEYMQRGAATNKAGYFMIPHLPDSTYQVTASFIGYKSEVQEITIKGGQIVSMVFQLTPNPILMDQIEVTAEVDREEDQNVSTFSLPAARIKNTPSIGESDLMRSLQMLPGIHAANELSSGLYIRGGSPDQNLILLDNITVYNPNHFFGFFSTFNNDAIKKVKLIKGGFPAEYGARLSGVLDITSKEGNREHFNTNGEVSLISSKILLEGPLPRGSYMISGRRTYFDLLVPLFAATDIPDYYFYDLNIKLNFDLSKKDQLIVSSYWGRDILDYLEEDLDKVTNKIHIGWGNRILSTQWRRLFNPRLFMTTTLAASQFSSRVEATNRDFPILFENSIRDISVKGDLEWYGFKHQVVRGGFWLTQNEFLNELQIGEDIGFSNHLFSKPFYLAVYLQDEWQPSTCWVIHSGLRLNYFSVGNQVHVEPRLQLRRKLSDKLNVNLGIGTYSQFTTVVVNDLASFADLWYPIDETVDALKSQQYIAGMNYSLFPGIRLQVEGYIKPMQNLLEFRPYQDTERTKMNEIFYVGSGVARGLEIFLKKWTGAFNGWLGYTWSRTERTFSELNRGEPFPAKWDFTHDLSAMLSWQMSDKWSISSFIIYRSGQAFTVPTGQYRLGPPQFPIDYIRAGRKNSARLEPYHRMDLSITYRFKGLGGQWNLTLNVYNLYNHRNVWFRNYDFNRSGNPVKIEDLRLLPILPTVELRFKY